MPFSVRLHKWPDIKLSETKSEIINNIMDKVRDAIILGCVCVLIQIYYVINIMININNICSRTRLLSVHLGGEVCKFHF